MIAGMIPTQLNLSGSLSCQTSQHPQILPQVSRSQTLSHLSVSTCPLREATRSTVQTYCTLQLNTCLDTLKRLKILDRYGIVDALVEAYLQKIIFQLQEQMSIKFKKQFPTRKELEIVSSTRIWKRQDKAARLIQKTYRDYVK